jgi:hypothetical protein
MNALAALLAAVTIVQGTILDLDNNQPVRAVRVQARTSLGVFQTLTGADGRFKFWNLPPGRITMTFERDGYSPASGLMCLTPGAMRTFRLSFAQGGSIMRAAGASRQFLRQERAAELLEGSDGTTLMNC